MTAARAGSPLCSPFRVKNARVTDSDGLISCGRTADFLVKTAAAALRLDVQSEAKRMCVRSGGREAGLMALSFVPFVILLQLHIGRRISLGMAVAGLAMAATLVISTSTQVGSAKGLERL
jgi:hypothetical protein